MFQTPKMKLTNPFATPVFEVPPPPPTITCLGVNNCTVYNGKLILAKISLMFLRFRDIFIRQNHIKSESIETSTYLTYNNNDYQSKTR